MNQAAWFLMLSGMAMGIGLSGIAGANLPQAVSFGFLGGAAGLMIWRASK